MINYFDNDYAVPIILGSTKDELLATRSIRTKTVADIHVFAQRLPITHRARCIFHKLPCNDRLFLHALIDFAESIHEYYTPILIYGSEFSHFVKSNAQELERRYITLPTQEVDAYFKNNEPKE